MYYTYSYTNIGKKRVNNQDRVSINGKLLRENEHYIASFLQDEKSCFIIADGMGGEEKGEVAAQMIVDYFNNHAVEFDEFAIKQSLQTVNEAVLVYSDEQLDGATSGSTVVGVLTLKNEALVFNAGDSLIYAFDNGGFTELSVTHNTYTYEAKVKRPGMFPYPGGILEFIGNRNANRYFPYNIFKRKIKKGEVLFLSTDGVTNYYPDPTVLAQLFKSEKDLAVCAQTIINYVLARGASDNFSFSIIKKM